MDSKVLFKRFFFKVGIVFMPCFACVFWLFWPDRRIPDFAKILFGMEAVFKWIPYARNLGKFE
jgi:hypothetical protein